MVVTAITTPPIDGISLTAGWSGGYTSLVVQTCSSLLQPFVAPLKNFPTDMFPHLYIECRPPCRQCLQKWLVVIQLGGPRTVSLAGHYDSTDTSCGQTHGDGGLHQVSPVIRYITICCT